MLCCSQYKTQPDKLLISLVFLSMSKVRGLFYYLAILVSLIVLDIYQEVNPDQIHFVEQQNMPAYRCYQFKKLPKRLCFLKKLFEY